MDYISEKGKLYFTTKIEVDKDRLLEEKKSLGVQLAMSEPTKEELIELGKMNHEYYRRDEKAIQARIKEIEAILKL